ncbi:hypothetical protein RchiOBHm_Chr6g0261131 [Rosa chinensis]|uniref:Uncharacterized protein n=1 Tax=Rosa chinensis TaxID=74649 RepID=A0A2P6PNB0_ROSCH|nr:hypothetical protein RchiOBHm_Chr6g0261131 [Rosa chinensis]
MSLVFLVYCIQITENSFFFSIGLCRNPMKILIPTINVGALKIITRNQLFVCQNRVLKFKSGDLLKSMKTKHHHLTCTSLTLKRDIVVLYINHIAPGGLLQWRFGFMGTILSRFLLLWWFWRTGQLAEHHFINDCGSLCQTRRAKYELWVSLRGYMQDWLSHCLCGC